jgi:type IV secretion system protein VirB1
MLSAALLSCALNVSPLTLDAIVRVESGHNPIAINVNQTIGKPVIGPQHPTSAADAAAITRKYIAAGYSVDVGYTQWNSRNFLKAGVSVEDALEPCRNLAGGAAILSTFYAKAVVRFGEGQPALLSALSAYNSGTSRQDSPMAISQNTTSARHCPNPSGL